MTEIKMDEEGDVAEPVLPWDDEIQAHLVAYVEEMGRRRVAAHGEEFSEVDYLCGAMAIFFALGWNDKVPAGWVFGPMSGRPVLRTERQQAQHQAWMERNKLKVTEFKDLIRTSRLALTDALNKVEELEGLA
jgi:hypothetical protein